MSSELILHRPSVLKQKLEKLGVVTVYPWDITSDVDSLYRKYPDLAGDITAIGVSDFDGHCQSWCNNPGWWRRLPGMLGK